MLYMISIYIRKNNSMIFVENFSNKLSFRGFEKACLIFGTFDLRF